MNSLAKPLHAVCEVIMGQAPSGESYNSDGVGLPLIAGAGDFGLLHPEAKKFTNAPTKIGVNGDIILGIRASIGAKVIADAEYCLGRGVAALRPKQPLHDRFLWHWLDVAQPELLSKARGATFLQVNRQDIRDLEIPLPLLAEQKRIAGILDAADALRAKRRAALAQLDALAQSLFLDRFGDPVTNPKGWEEVPLNSICRPKQWPTIGKQDLLPSGFPVYGANGQIGYFSRFNHAEPTVLITCRGATCGTINVCEPNSYVTGNAMALDDPDLSRITIKFLESVLRITDFSAVITGVAQPQITRQSLAYLSIPVPPLPLQQSFAAAVEAIERQKARHREQLAGLDALFASLQHRAFRGEL